MKRPQKLTNGTPCLLWPGAVGPNGYGRQNVNGRRRASHLLMYERCIGPVPEGLVLDHLCRNRSCANPLHLEPVTILENILRGETVPARNKAKTHCHLGHPFSKENTYILLVRNGLTARQCKECTRRRARESVIRHRNDPK